MASETIGRLPKIKVPTAMEICRSVPLSPEASALLSEQATIPAFLSALMAAELWSDAVALMARALPKREAVWWACLAARASTIGAETLPAVVAALEAAEAWVYRPTDEHRRTAMERAQATRFDHPGAWAAVAAFWSGGSMAPANLPAVLPADHLTAVAVAGAVTLAAVMREPERAPERFGTFLDQAIDIANGGNGHLKAAS